MIKKVEMLEKARMVLAGGDPVADKTSRFPPGLVESVLAEAYDTLLLQGYQAKSMGILGKDQFLLDNYTKTFTPTTEKPVVVQYDSEREQYYSELPSPVVVLPNNEGIRLIAPVNNPKGAGTPLSGVGSVIRESLTVSKINTRFTYFIEGNKIWYKFPITVMENLMMKLVVPFDDLDDEDTVDEPSVMTKNGLYTIYDYVLQRLTPMAPTDQTENNNPV